MNGKHIGLLVLLLSLLAPAVQAQTSRIFFATAQSPSADQDVWYLRPGTATEIQYTSEVTDANAPSVCDDGNRFFYDVGGVAGIPEAGGNLYVKDLGRPTAPQQVLDCLGQNQVCLDVDCGAPASGLTPNNPRIVYTLVNNGTSSNIQMATWSSALRILENHVALTNDPQASFPPGNKNEHPAWCGPDHVVWTRYAWDGGDNEFTICKMQVDSAGPVAGSIQCHDTEADDSLDGGDELSERHPSCGVVNGQLKIVYANSKSGNAPYGSNRICMINADFSGPEECTPDTHIHIDQTMPTLSPDGTQIAFSRAILSAPAPDDDYEIYLIQTNDMNTSAVPAGPGDTVDDLDPDWAY